MSPHDSIPRAFKYGLLIAIVLAMVPPMLIAKTRAVPSSRPRVHLVQDMDNQHKFRAQHANPYFLDGRAMRPPGPGTVARGELREDDHFERGYVMGWDDRQGRQVAQWAPTFPGALDVNMELLARGRERFNIYCQPCHGLAGYGDGIVNQRAMALVNVGADGLQWVQAKSLHEPAIREQPVGQIFNTITNGVRTMPAYGPQIPTEDRWAIVAYVQALQRSQNVEYPEGVPATEEAAPPDGQDGAEGQTP